MAILYHTVARGPVGRESVKLPDLYEDQNAVSLRESELAERTAGDRWVRPSTPEDGPAIVALMRSVGLEPHSDPEHLRWKYWQERGDWSGSRSFVLTDGRELLAHLAVVPGAIRYGGNRARVIHMIDWAARREAAGAGIQLAKRVAQLSDLVLATGGSRHTRRILPLLGYIESGSIVGYVRTLSPLGILSRPIPSRRKLVPRMARSLLWSIKAPRGDMAGWQVRSIESGQIEQLRDAFPGQLPGMAVFERGPGLLRHALSCPIVPMDLCALEKGGRVGGYFLLSYAPGQARIADMWMASQDPADWRSLVYAAVNRARGRGRLAELIAWSSDPALSRILGDCGFHERMRLPVCLRAQPDAKIPPDIMRVQMLDSDAFYLYFGGNELWA